MKRKVVLEKNCEEITPQDIKQNSIIIAVKMVGGTIYQLHRKRDGGYLWFRVNNDSYSIHATVNDGTMSATIKSTLGLGFFVWCFDGPNRLREFAQFVLDRTP